jgi:hypothetical protein
VTDPAEPTPNAEVHRRLDAVLERFPDRFAPEQIAEIRGQITQAVENSAHLAGLKLPNHVGPWFDPRSMDK